MSSPANPPVSIPAGQSVVYIGATTFSASGSANPPNPPGVAVATSFTGSGGLSLSGPLIQQSCQANWSNYVVTPNLAIATVHAIYPYMEYNGSITQSNWSTFLDGSLVTGMSGSFNSSFHTSSLGTSLSLINPVTASFFGEATAPIGPISDSLNITWVGVAVYITTPPVPSVDVYLSTQQYANVGFN